MATALLIVRIAELVLFGGLAAASFKRWHDGRDPSGIWAAFTFGVVAAVIVPAMLLDPNSESDIASWARKVIVGVLLLFPYFLFRYAAEFRSPSVRLRRVAIALTAGVVGWTFLLGKIHGQHAPRTTALDLFVLGVVVQWTVLSVAVTAILWRSGRAQAAVARNRMRMLALGSGILNLAVIISAFLPSDDQSAGPVVTGLIAIVAVLFFFMGFVPPRFLRVMWRTPDSRLLRNAEVSLMSVLDPADIGNALLPHVMRLFGGEGAVLVNRRGDAVAVYGLSAADAKATAARAVEAGDQPIVEPGLLSVAMRRGWLAVRGSMVTPFFGKEEVDLLVGLGVFADLALERGELFVLERGARQDAERANTELETFVYSVSHDLKSPLVSLLGFLDYLKADIETANLGGDARFFLERISAAGMYMQALIQDLLELSRIGRVQTEPMPVDLALVLDEVTSELAVGHEGAHFEIGPLPVIDINPLRARQLFTNLVNNALVHSGRTDVTISVAAVESVDGGVSVVVSDNGKGIAAEYRERVFGVFERLERQDADTTGTGIGLAVCRKIVESCGGRISISDNPDPRGPAPAGVRFVMTFPAAVVRRGPTTLEAAR